MKGKNDLKKQLFRMGSSRFKCQTPKDSEKEYRPRYLSKIQGITLDIQEHTVDKNVVACKMPLTANLSNRKRLRRESEVMRDAIKTSRSKRNSKLNQMLSTIVQRCDNIVEEGRLEVKSF